MGKQSRREHREPTTGIDVGAGETSEPGSTQDATSTGPTSTAEGSTGTAQPSGPAAGVDRDPSEEEPIRVTEHTESEHGSTGRS